ncbi:type IV secretion system protein [Phenylobacterium sp. LjRoot225]|uniref:type IV secretion system protein n=1 Tax=Phenylobacterium sp. LjRoot225 TaxID=3342285 RepID=UPI003ED159E3
MTACLPLPIDGDATLTATLGALDCQVNDAVASGYGHLFGAGGALGLALSAGLTIYLTVIALGLLTGHTRLTLGALGPKVLTLGFVLTFATAWPAYQTVVYGLLTGGPDQVASAFLGAKAGATRAFAARLDVLFDAVLEIGRSLAAMPKAPNLELASKLVWASAILLLLATLGLLVIARIVLAVLLALGPVFLVFSLFDATRGLFEGWLRTAVAFAIAPTLVVLGGSGLLAVIGPLISAVADDPNAAVSALRPIVTLFLACVIYAGLVATLAATAAALTRGWRIRASGPAPDAASAPAAAPALSDATRELRETTAHSNDRVSGLATAVLRETGRASEQRSAAMVEALSLPTSDIRGGRRRVEGLGQTFRPGASRRPLSGTIGP